MYLMRRVCVARAVKMIGHCEIHLRALSYVSILPGIVEATTGTDEYAHLLHP